MVDLRQFDKGTIKPGNNQGTSPQKLHTAEDGQPKVTQQSDAALESKELKSDEQEMQPTQVEEFRDYLKEQDITDAHIFEALDSLITTGSFEWEFQLFGKVPCVFKARPQWVEQLVIDKMEELSPKTYARFTNTLNMYNLAGSLAQYGSTAFSPGSVEELHTVINHVGKLPNVVIKKLVNQLVIFDRIMAVATSNWAVENFS